LKNNAKEIALFFAKTLHEKNAKDTVILNISNISIIADYFIIATAQSPTHIKALSNSLLEKLKENDINRNAVFEGNHNTGWLLIDCGDIVVHLFLEEKRDYYNLEYVWQEAEKIFF